MLISAFANYLRRYDENTKIILRDAARVPVYTRMRMLAHVYLTVNSNHVYRCLLILFLHDFVHDAIRATVPYIYLLRVCTVKTHNIAHA